MTSQTSSEDQRPTPSTLCSVLRSEGSWKCLLLTTLIYGFLGAITWCRLTEVERVFINFSVYPIHTKRHISACEDAFLYIPLGFLVLLYLVYLVECYHSPTRIQLIRTIDADAICRRVRIMKSAVPIVWWKAICYHYVRRKRQITRYRNGDSYTTTQVYYERVNSHSASTTFSHAYCGFQDISRNLILDSTTSPIIKVRFSKGFAFTNIEAASEFEDQRSRFFSEHERYDDYMEMKEGLDLTGLPTFKENLVACRDSDKAPWYASQCVYWLLSCLLLSWPLRILIEYNTAHVHYTVIKVFGNNYENLSPNHALREESSTIQSNLINGTSLPANTNPDTIYDHVHTLNHQAAVLSNGLHAFHNPSTMTNSQNGINLPVRNRSNMSHTSTIDSLEFYATIRENCALVPSYSEALLLESNVEGHNPTEVNNEREIDVHSPMNLSNTIDSTTELNTNIQSTSGTNVNDINTPLLNINTRRKIDTSIIAATPNATLQSSISNYSLKTRNNNSISHRKILNRRSWNGFFRPSSINRHIYRNPIINENTAISIASIDGDSVDGNSTNNLYYASPLLSICPTDPFQGRNVTTPTDNPPSYEDALNFPALRAITRSITDMNIFSSSRSYLNDSINNRRSCIETSTDNIRLIRDNPATPRRIINMETSL